jgi:hypothetical protein
MRKMAVLPTQGNGLARSQGSEIHAGEQRHQGAAAASAAAAGICVGTPPSGGRAAGHWPQNRSGSFDGSGVGCLPRPSLSGSRVPRLGRLGASLRDGFASLDPTPAHKDSAPTRKKGVKQLPSLSRGPTTSGSPTRPIPSATSYPLALLGTPHNP